MKLLELYVDDAQQVCIYQGKVIKVISNNDADLTRTEYINPVLEKMGIKICFTKGLTPGQKLQAEKLGAEFYD